MSLIDLIREHTNAQAIAGDWAAVAALLNARTVVVRDTTPVTYAMLTRDLGDAARQLVAGTLRAIAKSNAPEAGEIADAHQVLLNEQGGLTLHSDERQAMIDQVAAIGSWPDDLRNAIKAKGVRLTSLSDATPDECENEWDTAIRETRNQNLTDRFNTILNQLGTVEHTDGIAALRAMADEEEG